MTVKIPHDLDMERALLGALATDAPTARKAMGAHRGVELFHGPGHRLVYEAITRLDDAGSYVDQVTIADRLRTDGLLDQLGGVAALVEACPAAVPERAGQYAARLAELARQRAIQAAAADAGALAERGDADGAVRRLFHALSVDAPVGLGRVKMVDWDDLWQRPRKADWVLEPVLPRGKAVNLYAPRGEGKSELALAMAAALATGRAILDQPAGDGVHVVYMDFEMGEDDLVDRLTDLGYGPGDDLYKLHYACLPEVPKLNTAEGGAVVVEVVRTHGAEVLVVDTLARVAEGEENSNDTWIGLANWCILPLKQSGDVTSLWLGHAGKDITKGERGGSAKGDAVDCIWKQTRGDGGSVVLRNEKRRAGWVPEKVLLHRVESDGTIAYRKASDEWPSGTNVAVVELDAAGAPLDITRRDAAALLKEKGHGCRNEVVSAALRFRRQRPAGSGHGFGG